MDLRKSFFFFFFFLGRPCRELLLNRFWDFFLLVWDAFSDAGRSSSLGGRAQTCGRLRCRNVCIPSLFMSLCINELQLEISEFLILSQKGYLSVVENYQYNLCSFVTSVQIPQRSPLEKILGWN